MALTGKVAVDFDYYKDILGRVRDEAKDVGFRKAYDDMLDALVTVHEEGYKDPETGEPYQFKFRRYPDLPKRIKQLRNQNLSSVEILKELRPTNWKESLAGIDPFPSGKGVVYKDTLSELKLMLQPFADAAGLAADFLPGFEKPPNLLTEKGRKEAALRYPGLGALGGLALEVAKLAPPLGPRYTGKEFKEEFPMISGLAAYYGDNYNFFTADGREKFKRHMESNGAGFLGDVSMVIAPWTRALKAAAITGRVSKALGATKLGQSTGGKIAGTVIKNLDIDPVAMVTEAGGTVIGKGAEGIVKFSENAFAFAGSRLSQSPFRAAKAILEKSDPTVGKMLKGEMTYDEILAPFVVAADEAWVKASRDWKQNEANLRGITDELGNPKNFNYILDEVEKRAKRQLEALNVTLKSREQVLKEAVISGQPERLPGQMIAGKPPILEEAIVTEKLIPIFAGKLETDKINQQKIRDLWKTVHSTKNEALLNGMKRPDGNPFIDFDDLQEMKQSIDIIGGKNDESKIYKALYGPMKETVTSNMVNDIGNYEILNEDWKKMMIVAEGADDALNIPARQPGARKSMMTPTAPDEMPAQIKKRRAAIEGILSVFSRPDPYGRMATDRLSKLVPGTDLTAVAAGFHFLDPVPKVAGGAVYATAATRALLANPLIAPTAALTSPTVFGKMLQGWVDKKTAMQTMHFMEANKLGPYRLLAIETPKLLTTEAGRAASKLGVRAGKGGAIDTIRQSLYQPSTTAEPVRPYTEEQIRRQQGWPARPE